MGEGANQGLLDTYHFARFLSDRSITIGKAFENYQDLRKKETAEFREQSKDEGYFLSVSEKDCRRRDEVYEKIVWAEDAVIRRQKDMESREF